MSFLVHQAFTQHRNAGPSSPPRFETRDAGVPLVASQSVRARQSHALTLPVRLAFIAHASIIYF